MFQFQIVPNRTEFCALLPGWNIQVFNNPFNVVYIGIGRGRKVMRIIFNEYDEPVPYRIKTNHT